MAEGERRRSDSLASLCAAAPAVSSTPPGPSEGPDDCKRGEASQYRGNRQCDQRSKDTDRVQSVHPAPVDGMNASFDDGRTDETADEGMA